MRVAEMPVLKLKLLKQPTDTDTQENMVMRMMPPISADNVKKNDPLIRHIMSLEMPKSSNRKKRSYTHHDPRKTG